MSLSIEIGLIIATLLSLKLMFFEKKLYIFKTIILFIFSLLLSVSIFSLGSDIYKIAFYPTYKATITHIDKYLEDDIEGGGEYLMYQPTYTFNNGQKDIQIKSSKGTRRKLEIGDTVNIAYKNGEFLGSAIDSFIVGIAKALGVFLSFFIIFSIMGTVFTKRSSIRKYHSWMDNMLVLFFLFSFLLPLSLGSLYIIFG